jgi:hypothetical protein
MENLELNKLRFETSKAWKKYSEVNETIRQQFISVGIIVNKKNTGKKIEDVDNDFWQTWIKDLISLRDSLLTEFNNVNSQYEKLKGV